MFDLRKRVGFELEKNLIFYVFLFGDLFGVFLNPFWGHSLSMFCRVLSVLQLL
jgi:hypothetical protein